MTRPIPVLMYHHINPHKGDMVTITPETFEGQMRHLKIKGYRTLKADELESYIKGETILDKKSVLITFDDGWLDNYIYAFPILKKYRINAVVFIITDRTESASAKTNSLLNHIPDHKKSKALIQNGEAFRVVLGWDHVKEMSESGLVEFYPHTKSHRRCGELSEPELHDELAGSKAIMESRLGKPCPYLCWPYGSYNETAVKTARETGYKMIFTTDPGVANAGSDPFSIKRIVVKEGVSWFKKRLFTYTSPVFSKLYLRMKKAKKGIT